MYEELIKTLRFYGRFESRSAEAADAIEELQKKIAEWQEEACKWNNEYLP